MFTKAAFKARRASRKAAQSPMLTIMREGEKAAAKGEPQTANPYEAGTEDAELWMEGWEDVAGERAA